MNRLYFTFIGLMFLLLPCLWIQQRHINALILFGVLTIGLFAFDKISNKPNGKEKKTIDKIYKEINEK